MHPHSRRFLLSSLYNSRLLCTTSELPTIRNTAVHATQYRQQCSPQRFRFPCLFAEVILRLPETYSFFITVCQQDKCTNRYTKTTMFSNTNLLFIIYTVLEKPEGAFRIRASAGLVWSQLCSGFEQMRDALVETALVPADNFELVVCIGNFLLRLQTGRSDVLVESGWRFELQKSDIVVGRFQVVFRMWCDLRNFDFLVLRTVVVSFKVQDA